jgi:hypothetical protein
MAKKRKKDKRHRGGWDEASAGQRGAGSGLARLFGDEPGRQFLAGALIGAAAAYVLGDEQLRGRLLRAGMNLFASLAGEVEEMKEQMADIRAEMEAQERGEA